MRSLRPTFSVVAVLVLLAALTVRPRVTAAQDTPSTESALVQRGPRFLLATSAGGSTPIDVERMPALRERIALDLDNVPLDDALAAIARESGIRLVYSGAALDFSKRVTFRTDRVSVAAALTEVLLDAKIDVLFAPGGRQAVLVARAAAPVPGVVVGRVTDAKTGEGLVGAEVSLDGTRHRTTAGEDGRYRLGDVAAGSYTLTVRRIGYGRQTREVTVADGAEVMIDVALEAIPTQLDDVVTTVTGEQRLRELGHVVGRINADSVVREAPVSNLAELLNGRVPGLQAFTTSGVVGGAATLQVRGPNSLLLGTEPIVIVDGIRYTSGTDWNATGPFQVEATSRLNDLNPNDIESIEVVKGPSAATLYGTDASNGVIVITTKRGQPGPARWTAYAKTTVSAIPRIHYPDRYWAWSDEFGAGLSCALSLQAEGYCAQDSVTVLPNPLNDPALTVFGSQPRWEYGASVAGGRQDLRYYFSGEFERATGPVQMPPALADSLRRLRGSALPEEQLEPNALTKLHLRSNVTAVFGERAELRANAGYSRSATRTGTQNSAYIGAGTSGDPTHPYGGAGSPASNFVRTSTERIDRFIGSVSGQWRPTAWLQGRATAGLDLTSTMRASLVRRGEGSRFNPGIVGDDRGRLAATSADLGLTATARAGRLSSRTTVGVQYVRTLSDAASSTGAGLPPGGESIGEASSTRSSQRYNETVTLGSYLETMMGLNDRLFLTGALRVDGASAFGQDYDAVVYPKVSASWLLSEEPFVPRLPGLSELRLRYAFGASGQQATSVMVQPQFAAGQAFLGGRAAPAVELAGLGNPNLRPERVREHEFGFDAAALENRVQLGLTWYRRRTVDQIVAMALAPGFGSIHTNLGLTTQHGFEAEVAARVLDTRFLSWDLTFRHSVHRTRLLDLGGAVPRYTNDGGYVEGYPLGARFVRPVVGYADANGDGMLALGEVQMGDAAVYAGQSTPPRSQTLTAVVGLFQRRVRLSALVERRSDFTQINWLTVGQCMQGTCPAAVDPSTSLAEQAEVIALFQSAAPGTGAYFMFLEPGDLTRLREVTAAVDLPSRLVRALRLSSATLAVSARNLALWTDFSGPDPESARVTGLVNDWGGSIPQGRSWTVRLDLGL